MFHKIRNLFVHKPGRARSDWSVQTVALRALVYAENAPRVIHDTQSDQTLSDLCRIYNM